MTWLEIAAIAVAGIGAGFVNTLAGSGTLLTFPTLLAFGVPPVTANVSNNIGLVPGALSAAWGWREELRHQKRRLLRLAPASFVGGLTGAVLLLVLPAEAFEAVVPVLVALGLVLVAVQPWINRRINARADARARSPATTGRRSPRSPRPGCTAATSAPPRASCSSGRSGSPPASRCTPPTP